MNLLDIFTNFNIKKGFGKFFLGAIGAGIAYVIQDPSVISSIIPEQWQTLTLVGIVVEVLDYIKNLIDKAKE